MLVKIQLKNSLKTAIVDDFTYDYLINNPRLKELEFVHNLREHSTGCVVFQKSWRQTNGTYKTETIYLHKLVAEKFITKPLDSTKRFIMIKNENRLDCRIDNLAWSDRSGIKRNIRKTNSKTGFLGVFKDRNRYVARIYVNRKPIDIGRFDTAEEAALAYNEKSRELFGETRNLNRVNGKTS